MRIATEKKVVEAMIKIYCKNNHGFPVLCNECSELRDYAILKLEKCNFGEKKPACKKCKIHCYPIEKRNQIKKIMRYSGKRLILKYPLITLKHILK